MASLDHLGFLFRYHEYQILTAALTKAPILYSEFPIFETRLRQLRHYIDSPKPPGLRHIWRDKRDSLSYYTFWGVIIFGLLSVFIVFFFFGGERCSDSPLVSCT